MVACKLSIADTPALTALITFISGAVKESYNSIAVLIVAKFFTYFL